MEWQVIYFARWCNAAVGDVVGEFLEAFVYSVFEHRVTMHRRGPKPIGTFANSILK